MNSMEYGLDVNVSVEMQGGSTCNGTNLDRTSDDGALPQVLDDKFALDISEGGIVPAEVQHASEVTADEPNVGQEFESEAAARAFYNAYATRVGFIIRVSKLIRSGRDGSCIGRAFVCNKEGYRIPRKRDNVVMQRAETRVGCRAMILVKKVSSEKWVVSRFEKDHTHILTPGKGRKDCIYNQYPNEHDKIRELSQQLNLEKKRAENYKRHLEMLFEHIEQHNEMLSNKIRHIVDSVRDMDAKALQSLR